MYETFLTILETINIEIYSRNAQTKYKEIKMAYEAAIEQEKLSDILSSDLNNSDDPIKKPPKRKL